ncbi:hypothetical protein MGMO_120c00270 [Methyloglobulus morosus KoM1]|uniref:Uncharacterized protein n=1 Tax=Methyloglobulus morosus KoM1 TaxID=1116472 RepID=V5BBK0_9GAMM|nr:hypothetical protein [Methyloglobulus morosus]ESS70640.1 hypothetical protein MGMO_120c00270 [Methyloglobulus morosus KoM1]
MNAITNIFMPDDYIQEAVSPMSGVLIMTCTVGDNYDDPINRILELRNGSWMEFGLAGEVFLSIDAKKDGKAYVLGEGGTVFRFNWLAETQEELKASRVLIENSIVEEIGPLRQIRVVGEDVICGGSVGQMYRLNGDQFKALPQLNIGGVEPTIEGISGNSSSDFIVVTSDGLGAWFNGSNWHNLDLPTNVNLTSVCLLYDGRYAIAGYDGTILLGNREHWSIIEPINEERSYWGIATRDGVVYVSHSGGIDMLRDNKLTSLDIPKSNKHEFTGLTSGIDGIWSCSGQTIGIITADEWRTIISNPLHDRTADDP